MTLTRFSKKHKKTLTLFTIIALVLNVFVIALMPISTNASENKGSEEESTTMKAAPKEKVFKSKNTGNFSYDDAINSIGWYDKATKNNPDGGMILGTRFKTDENDTAVYCLNWDLDSPKSEGNTYKATNEKITDKEYSAMVYGYGGEKDITGKYTNPKTKKKYEANERYYITQMALYAVTNDKGTKNHVRLKDMVEHNRGLLDESKVSSKAILKAVEKQVKHIENNTLKVPKEETINIVIEGTKDNDMLQKDGYFESKNPIKINVDNTKGNLKLNKKGMNNAYFVDSNGKEVEDSFVLNGNEVFLRLDIKNAKEDRKGSIEFSVSGEVEYTNLTKYTPKSSKDIGAEGEELQRITWVSKEKSEAESNFKTNYDYVEGELEITKKELGSDKVLPDAEFVIKDSKGEVVREGTTDEDGIIKFKELPKGEYTYQETKAPKGYVLDTEAYPFEISTSGEVIKVEAKNKKILGTMNVEKTDSETEKPLEGVEYTVLDENGDIVEEGKTNEDGKIVFKDLPMGEYVLKETKALEGYVIDEEEYDFAIEEDGQKVNKELTNTVIKGNLEIIKTDVSTSDLLPNAKFEIKDEDGEVIREGETDDEGIAYFEEIPYGEYTYREYDAPEGYVIDETEFPFEVKKDGEIIKAEMTNEIIKGDLEITKVDVSTGDLLSDAKFEIKDADGEVVREGTTDEDGIAYFEDLEYGEYTYREYDAPKGYVVDETEFPFEIKENGVVVKAEMTNEAKPTPPEPEEPTKDEPTTVEKVEEPKEEGKILPKTATDMYNMFAIGLALLLVGSGVAFFAYRQKRKKATDIGELDETTSDKE